MLFSITDSILLEVVVSRPRGISGTTIDTHSSISSQATVALSSPGLSNSSFTSPIPDNDTRDPSDLINPIPITNSHSITSAERLFPNEDIDQPLADQFVDSNYTLGESFGEPSENQNFAGDYFPNIVSEACN